jgi:HB1, ASXL, restriction endonuclease HTH domain
MGIREQFQKLIDRKSQEIKDLEAQIEKAKAYIQAMQDSMRLLPREAMNGNQEQSLRPGTALAKARDVLKEAGKPLHINELLKAMEKPTDKKNKLSLSGSLSTYVRSGQIFYRPAPNTFGLIEMAKTPPTDNSIDLPEDFGDMTSGES